MRCRLLAFGMMLVLTACGEQEPPMVVPIPEKLTLYSLKESEGLPQSLPDGAESFQGYQVLGKLEVTDRQQIKDLIIAFNRGIAEKGEQAKCFIPRHGFRTEKDKAVRDYVICFQCGNYYDYPRTDGLSSAISKSPQALFNQVLKKAGIPLNEEKAK